MRKLFLLFFVMLALSIAVQAQTRTITGKVIAKDDGQPLVGVTITIKGSSTATSTDIDGKFAIKTTNLENVTVGAKYLGYQYQEVTLKGGEMNLTFTMEGTNSSLNEIVVTGYGTTIKGKILGAVSEIKAAEFEDLPTANLGTALRNRLPGIGVSVASGKPGALTTLSIRNPTVFSGGISGITASPLYIIDGLTATADDFNQLDASLVESISFLKDASAAIYGASGDKGVVLVTTKKGRNGKTQMSYSGYQGRSDAAMPPKMLNALQQATLLNDGFAAANAANTSRFSQADLDFLATNPYPSWYQTLWQASNLTRHTINLSGGTEKLQFFGGGSYYHETGNFAGIYDTKYNIRSGMTAKLSADVTAYISLNATYSNAFTSSIKASASDTETQQTLAIITTPLWVPLLINGLPNNYSDVNPPGAWNPIGLANSGTYLTSDVSNINLNSSLEWRPHFVKGLAFKVQYGKNNQSTTSKQYDEPYTVYNFNRAGQNGKLFSTTPTASKISQTVANSDQLQEGSGYFNTYQLISSVDYSRVIGKHTFDVTAVSDLSEGHSLSNLLYRTGQSIPGIDQLYAYPSGTTTVQLGTGVNTGKQSYLGKASYDYAGKYLMQFITRVDGSSNFPADHRWGAFPDLGLGWRVSEEDWFKKSLVSKYVNSLKLRLNVGLVGDDRIDPFQYNAEYTNATTPYLFGTTVVNGLDIGKYPNPSLTWERALTKNFGIDATFLNDKLTATIDLYSRHTTDAFQDLSSAGLPFTSGLSKAPVNYDIQDNWGSEFDLGYIQTINKDWSMQFNVNFAFTNSDIVKQFYAQGVLGTVTEYQNINIGENPHTYTGSNYGYIATGIIKTQADVDAILAKNPNYTISGVKPQPGFMNYQDVNGDGKIDANDITLMYPTVNSPFGCGFTIGTTYKTFKISINGSLQIGGHTNYDSKATKPPSTTLNGPVFWADHWTPDNVDAKYPRYDSPLIDQTSTFWSVSATALRINNMSASWSLPKALADRLKIPNLRILASGTNLWSIINPYGYKDPLTNNFSDYPTLRTFSIGLNLTL